MADMKSAPVPLRGAEGSISDPSVPPSRSAVGGVVMAAAYAGMLRLLRATELRQLTGSLLAQFRRHRGTKISN
jgi:hypothetical protein